MNYKEIEQLKISLPEAETYIANYTSAFDVKFAHHSTAIEGNTLSFMETKLVIEDRQSIGGKSLREIYEVANHHDAFMYICDQVKQGFSLNENKVKEIHRFLLDKIATHAGTYRLMMFLSPVQIMFHLVMMGKCTLCSENFIRTYR